MPEHSYFEDLEKEVFLTLPDKAVYFSEKDRLKEILKGCACRVGLKKERKILPIEGHYCPDEETIAQLKKNYGAANVAVRERKLDQQWIRGGGRLGTE